MAQNDESPDWEALLVKRIGLGIKRLRGKRSAAWLSDRTEEFGRRVPATVIARLDSGHRGSVLNIGEILVIAAALGVPPVQLIYPELPDGSTEALPGWESNADEAAAWFCGRGYLWRTEQDPSNPGGEIETHLASDQKMFRLIDERTQLRAAEFKASIGAGDAVTRAAGPEIGRRLREIERELDGYRTEK